MRVLGLDDPDLAEECKNMLIRATSREKIRAVMVDLLFREMTEEQDPEPQ